MKNTAARILAGMLTSLLIFATAACGKKEQIQIGEGETTALGVEEEQSPQWQYEPQVLNTGIDRETFFSLKQVGGNLYYAIYKGDETDEGAGDATYRIGKYSVVKNGTEELAPVLDGYPTMVDVGEDGSIFVIVSCWGDAAGGSRKKVERYDASGELQFEADISRWTDAVVEETDGYLREFCADGDGRFYIAYEKKVLLFDDRGGYVGEVEAFGDRRDVRILAMGRGKNGKVYACVQDDNYKGFLTEIDFAQKKAETVMESISCTSIGAGTEKDLLLNDGHDIVEYDVAEKKITSVFSWTDSGINGNTIRSVGVAADGKLLVVQCDWESNEWSVLAFPRLAEGAKKKEEIVLGTLYSVTVLDEAVAAFNRSSDQYHVKMKKYGKGDWSLEGAEEAWTQMQLELAAGGGPDIIDLSLNHAEILSRQALLEELTPYLEKSTVIGSEDFVEHMLEACTYDGKLSTLPKQFTLETIVTSSLDAGEGAGWTLEDLIALAERNPDTQLFPYTDKDRLLGVCMRGGLDGFVNWETGKCSFDTPEFIRVLQFVDRYGEVRKGDDSENSWLRMCQGDILLQEFGFYELEDIQIPNELLGSSANVVGFPTVDGTGETYTFINAMCGINANSQHKEGAWAFLESYVTTENSKYMYAFPAIKSRLEEQIQNAMDQEGRIKIQKNTDGSYIFDENGEPVPEYRKDKNGEYILDENGDPIPVIVTKSVYLDKQGSVIVDYHPLTEEEAEQMRELMRSAKPWSRQGDVIRTIIAEESAAFFEEQKSAEQVADIIQSRAQLYMNENR